MLAVLLSAAFVVIAVAQPAGVGPIGLEHSTYQVGEAFVFLESVVTRNRRIALGMIVRLMHQLGHGVAARDERPF